MNCMDKFVVESTTPHQQIMMKHKMGEGQDPQNNSFDPRFQLSSFVLINLFKKN